MDWLHSPSYWWSLVGSLGNICAIGVFVGTLIQLFMRHVNAWDAVVTFGIYLVLFAIEPPQNVQAALVKMPVEPEGALRTVLFAVSFFLLVKKSLRAKP